jgi:hypothetical protein
MEFWMMRIGHEVSLVNVEPLSLSTVTVPTATNKGLINEMVTKTKLKD